MAGLKLEHSSSSKVPTFLLFFPITSKKLLKCSKATLLVISRLSSYFFTYF